jgi:hypothetical protein
MITKKVNCKYCIKIISNNSTAPAELQGELLHIGSDFEESSDGFGNYTTYHIVDNTGLLHIIPVYYIKELKFLPESEVE